MENKELFISTIQAADSDFDEVLDSLPSCYALGYLTARFEELTDEQDDEKAHKRALLRWCEFDIWK